MKRIIKILLSLFFLTPITIVANEDVNTLVGKSVDKFYNSLSSGTSKVIKNYFGNDGTTDVSLTAGKDMQPMGSIVLVRPLTEMKINDVWFTQTQLNNYLIKGKDRQALNFGVGYRKLSEDKSHFWGLNTFFDIDSKNHQRVSFGGELVSGPFEITGNYYSGLSGSKKVGDFNERVLDGYDLIVGGQIPYLPWAKIYYENYSWNSIKNSKDSAGNKLSTEIQLTKNISFEAGINDNAITGKDEYVMVTYSYPPSEKPTINDGYSTQAFENSDVSKQMLRKVKRTNKVVVELEGALIVKGF
jgi:hypothetical protein